MVCAGFLFLCGELCFEILARRGVRAPKWKGYRQTDNSFQNNACPSEFFSFGATLDGAPSTAFPPPIPI